MGQGRRSDPGPGFVSLTERQTVRNSKVPGIDRLSLSFPVSGFDQEPASWGQLNQTWEGGELVERRGTKVSVVPGVDAFVGVQEIPGGKGQVFGKVEFNPARVLDPDGSSLAPVIALQSCAGRAWNAAAEVLTPACSLAEARVKRLDIALDFEEVESPEFYITGLLNVRRPWARRSFLYNDPARNCAETLAAGSGAGMTRLYDKHQEKPEVVAAGTVRWEVEARARWLNRLAGVRTFAQVDEETVSALARDRWEWSAMGVEVSATQRVIEKVARSGLSATKQRNLLGYLLLKAGGHASPMSASTHAEYERYLRELSVVISPDVFSGGVGFVGRLDFDSAREVIRAA